MTKKPNHNHNPYAKPFLESIDESDLTVADTNGFPGFLTLHSKREPLVIKETDYRGNRRISLRYHYPDKRDGVLRPGRRGIEIPLEAAQLVAQALNDLLDLVEARDSDSDPNPDSD